MANYRFNLRAAKFPLLSNFFGPSVAVRSRGDSDYITTNAYTGSAADDDLGIPQPMYMHNVMPVSHGVQSIAYSTALDNTCKNQSGFDQVIKAQDYYGLNHMICPAQGQNFVSTDSETWSSPLLPGDVRLSGTVSHAHVKQQTYICYSRLGVYKYDPISRTLQPLTLTGLDTKEVVGVTSAIGMLIAWTEDTIYYSSFENPEDFTPSMRTGAGSAQLVPLRGHIIAALPHTSGFIVYSTENAVYARATGDLAYPFSYDEVSGSSGITSARHVASDTTFGSHYVWSKAGMQIVRQDAATLIYPEITDFLTCGYLEDYINSYDDHNNIGTDTNHLVVHTTATQSCPNNLIKYSYTEPLEIVVNVVSNRYLSISYGIGKLSHILVYDIGLERFGKLRIDHTDVFTYTRPESFGEDTARASFGILQANGTLRLVDFKISSAATDAVYMFGRISASRDAVTLLDKLHLNGIFDPAGTAWINIISSLDNGTLLEDVYAVPYNKTEYALDYGLRLCARSHIVKISGTFNLSGLEADIRPGGFR
jgi:hypothetical protein